MKLSRLKKLSWAKVKDYSWRRLVRLTRHTRLYPFIYKSYWHYLLTPSREEDENQYHVPHHHRHHHSDADGATSHTAHHHSSSHGHRYYTARPHPGAGIGHQLANWMAGYWYAREFGLRFAHWPFSAGHAEDADTMSWEEFLGFGEDEVSVESLKAQGYKVRRLPSFHNHDSKAWALQRKIIASYRGKRVILMAEQDQFLRHLEKLREDYRRKFEAAKARRQDNVRYSADCFNIALHVRRGDIMQQGADAALERRRQDNGYFLTALRETIAHFSALQDKPVHVWLFSQGTPEQFPEFAAVENIHWCLDMPAQQSFLHMVRADALIFSKSSFSYKPALLSRGEKICPPEFWHGYPKSPHWHMADKRGHVSWADVAETKNETQQQ